MAKTYEPIATTTLSSTTSTVTFSSIPATYTDLILVINAFTSTEGNCYVRLNNVATSLYSSTRLYGNGTTASSDRFSSGTESNIANLTTTMGNVIIHFMDYANATTNKTFISRSNSTGYTMACVGLWRSTAAINRIDFSLSPTLQIGSTFTLYGIKAA